MIFLELEKVKKYLRVEHDYEDDIIEQLVESVNQTLSASGVERCEQYGDKYDLTVLMLVAYYYENRGETNGSGTGMPIGCQIAIEQLRNLNGE